MIALRIGLLVVLGSTLASSEDEVIKCPGGECVKLHLCRDGSIITDGSNLIDIRFNPDDPCEHYLLKCCTVPDDEGDQVIESPSEGETEFIEPPSSGPHSGNQISSNTGSSASTGSTGSIGSSDSAGPSGLPGTSGTTGSTVLSGSEISSGPSASSAGHGREQEGAIGNSGNYYGGSYPHGGGSFSSTFSQSSSMSSSSSSSQSYQQQWTGSQGQFGMGMGWGSNIGGSPTYGSGSPGFIGYNTGYPVMIGQSSQMGSVGQTITHAGYGTGQSAHGSGFKGLGAGVMGSPKHSEVHPGSPGKGAGPTVPLGGGVVNTNHGTEQMGSVGVITEQSQYSTGFKESIGHTIMQTGTSSGGVSGSQVGSSDGVTGTVHKIPPGASLAQTGHGTVQTNFVGPATGQTQHNAGQQGFIISHTGTTAGGLSGSQNGSNVGGSGTLQPVPSGGVSPTGHSSTQMGSPGLATGQTQHSTGQQGHAISQIETTTGGLSGTQHGSGAGGTKSEQMVPVAGSIAQTGHGMGYNGVTTGQSQHSTGQQGHTISQTGSTVGGLSGSQHSSSIGGIGTGQTVPVGGGVSPTGHGSTQMGSVGLVTGQTQHSAVQQGHTISQTGTAAGGLGVTGTGPKVPEGGVVSPSSNGTVMGSASTGLIQHNTGHKGSIGYTISQSGTSGGGLSGSLQGPTGGAVGIGTGQTIPAGGNTASHGITQTGSAGSSTGQKEYGVGQILSMDHYSGQTGTTEGGSLGLQHGPTGISARPPLSGSSVGGYENLPTHNLEGSNLLAGDLHTGSQTSGHYLQEQISIGQQASGTQSGAYQVIGSSGKPVATKPMHGTGNIVPSVGTVSKDQTKDAASLNAGISQHEQVSSHHQYQDNISTINLTQSINTAGSTQGHGQGQSGSSTVKHHDGDGCTSHTQKHTTHTQHHGYIKGQSQHSYGSGYNNMYYSGTTVNPILPPQENMGCGFRNPDGVGFRITGNSDGEAEYGEFPWMVAILKEEKALDQVINVYQCGGSLIHPQVVLTAAHCVQNKQPHEIKVRLGEWDTQTTNEIHDHQDRNVVEIVVHDKFYKGGLFNDFALLFLDKPAEIIETVNTVCLPPQDFNFDLSRCFASGWGKDVFGKEGKYQVILKKIELPVMPFNKCQDALRTTRLGKRFILNKSFICAGGEPKKDTCKGDGGSPLVCPIPGSANRFYQAGIVAWGIGCGEHGIPGVYANVAGSRAWIDGHLTQRSIPHDYYIAV